MNMMSSANATVFFGYAIILLLLGFTALFALLPIRDKFRKSYRKSLPLFIFGVLVLIAALSFIGMMTGIKVQTVFVLGLFPLFLFCALLVDIAFIKKLFCFMNATMITANALVFGALIAAPRELENDGPVFLPLSGLFFVLSASVLTLLYWKTLATKLPYLISRDALDFNWRFVVLIPMIISALFYFVMPKSPEVVMTGRVRITTLLFLTLGPATFLLVYQSLWRIAVNLTENARLRAENSLNSMQNKRYAELQDYMNQTRELRHDFRQHLIAVNEYAKNGEIDKLTDYISQFASSLADHKGRFALNPALDALASHYDKIASEQDTEIKWLIELTDTLPVSESHFVSIFGNLLENALLAVSDLPKDKRIIHVNARMMSEAMLGLTISNPYEGEIIMKNDGLPMTSKAAGGVGLTSVAATIHKYNGELSITTDNGIFSAGVLLYIQ